VVAAEAYLHAKLHLDPSSCVATIHQRHRQDRQRDKQDRQRSDSIGRTVLQMVAQKLKPGLVTSYDIQPGNTEDLFWFRCFMNLSLTYLLFQTESTVEEDKIDE